MSGGSCGLHTVFAPDTTDDKLLSSVLHWVAENPGVRLLTLQFAGLDCAGKMAALSKRTRTSIKESNHFGLLLRSLKEIGDEQNARDGTRSIDTLIETHLSFAARLGLDDLVPALLTAGADKNKVEKRGATPLLIAAGADVNQATADGITPLAAAEESDHAEVAELLTAAGGDAGL